MYIITAETGSTGAVVFVNQIDARRSVEALMALTIVDIVLALPTVEALDAGAGVVARRVLAAHKVAA